MLLFEIIFFLINNYESLVFIKTIVYKVVGKIVKFSKLICKFFL